MVMYQGHNLQPGLYLQQGTAIKALEGALDAWRENAASNGYAPTAPETLAACVPWVFVAIERRKQRLAEIPFQWRRGEDDLETLPLTFNTLDIMPRLDEALQLYKRAYLFKQRGGRGLLAGLRWFDPLSMTPDYRTADVNAGGVQWYWRQTNYKRDRVPAEDLLVFEMQGMRELGPGTPAGQATSLAAQILYGIQQTADTVFDNNALPVMLIEVPRETSDGDVKGLEGMFGRLFNPKTKGTKEYRSKAIKRDSQGNGIKVTPLSVKPSELAMTPLSALAMNQILASHFVPQSEALSDASNRSVSENDSRRFTETMGARAKWLAGVINADVDIQKLGLVLEYYPEQHGSMSVSETTMADTFTKLLQGLTPEAAGYIAGIKVEDFPDDMQARGVFKTASPVPAEPAPVVVEDKEDDIPADGMEEMKSLRLDLTRWQTKATKALAKQDRARMVEFTSDYIPGILNDVLSEMLRDAQNEREIKRIFALVNT